MIGHPAMPVIVSAQHVHEAHEYHRRVVSLVERTPTYTGLCTPDRFIVGRICERALALVFEAHDVRFRWLTNDRGVPDEADFEVWRGGQRVLVDIKGSAASNAQRLLMPVAQFERHAAHRGPRSCFVAAWMRMLHDGAALVILWGVVSLSRFVAAAQRHAAKSEAFAKVETLSMGFSDMFPMQHFLAALERIQPRSAA